MISDGKNIMINNKEILKLFLLLRYLDDHCIELFQAENEEDMIVRKWIHNWSIAIMKVKEDPFTNIEL